MWSIATVSRAARNNVVQQQTTLVQKVAYNSFELMEDTSTLAGTTVRTKLRISREIDDGNNLIIFWN